MGNRIDRERLVRRHNPCLRGIYPLAPLGVGNGEFVYTIDATGMQSFPTAYQAPLSSQSQWGWNVSKPEPSAPMIYTPLASDPRQVGYPLKSDPLSPAYHWKRQNPHRLQLGQVGMTLMRHGPLEVDISRLGEALQILDLWTGQVHSRFTLSGYAANVHTSCHPSRDQIGVSIEGNLVIQEDFAIVVRFPSTECAHEDWRKDIPLNWDPDPQHGVDWLVVDDGVLFTRQLDGQAYTLRIKARLKGVRQVQWNAFVLSPRVAKSHPQWHIAFGFFPGAGDPVLDSVETIAAKSRDHWQNFWSHGGAIDWSESRDSRAAELERRVVLSQYLTAIHCSGSLPPQETGLAYNSWFGKFHLEMTWWHATHFFLWGRGTLAQSTLQWYRRTLPQAKELARSQGYKGARWPKTVGPDGDQSPSPIAPLLLWQQPHPIFLAALSYRLEPTEGTLKAYAEVVAETARFMVDRLEWDPARACYVLPPPLIPVQETHDPEASQNPVFELEYWHYTLGLAIDWLSRLNLKVPDSWRQVYGGLSPLPSQQGVYLAHEGCLETYERQNRDHPSMLGAYGMLPGSRVDPKVMKATFQKVLRTWQMDTVWGWDFPMMAMTAARLGESEWAVDALMMETEKNQYLINGHNYQDESLLVYLPGNGGLLAAVAMMAAGWLGGPKGQHSPGFPRDGRWALAWENLHGCL